MENLFKSHKTPRLTSTLCPLLSLFSAAKKKEEDEDDMADLEAWAAI